MLIDMQPKLVGGLALGEAEKIISCQLRVIDELCIKQDVPLITLVYQGRGITIDCLLKESLKIPRSRRATFVKSTRDGFEVEELRAHIKKLEVNTLVLMGIHADRCVKETAESAVARGYDIVTAEDLIAGLPCHSRNKSADWYAQYGLFYDNTETLLKDIILAKEENKKTKGLYFTGRP